MCMKNALLIAGHIVILGVLVWAFYSIIKKIVIAIKEKAWQALFFQLLILLICVAICVFLVKPASIVEKLLALLA